jgi:carbamoyltransferase
VSEWFDLDGRPGSLLGAPGGGYDCAYMSLTAPIRSERTRAVNAPVRRLGGLDLPRNELAACTHVDGSARVQTVRPEEDSLLHALILEFEKITSVPVLLNTSFNRSGEPIVCTPEDAVDCFLDTDIDYLCMENTVAWKTEQAGAFLRE